MKLFIHGPRRFALALMLAYTGLVLADDAGLKSIDSPVVTAQSEKKIPSSRDALFGDDPEPPKKSDAAKEINSPTAPSPAAEPSSKDALFGDDLPPPKKTSAKADLRPASDWKGFIQGELARTIDSPVHWSKMMIRAELGKQGRFNEDVKWKLSGRADYDAAYDLFDYYPGPVRRDQRFNFYLRENYLDISSGNWDYRLGRQHVVWGEVVGLFFADVVSAKDMREFILPDFDVLRIPQWAARAEYFKNDFHAELLWVPVASYDEIGKPGADFFPYAPPAPPGYATVYRNEVRPARTLENTNYGIRLSTLTHGWDLSGFYYRSMDSAPTFYREIVSTPVPTFIYQARHDRIEQVGGTLAKDIGPAVLKAEAVYTHGRQYNVTRLSDADGVVPQNTLDWIASADFNLPADTRLNFQLFQRVFFNHDADIIPEKRENGFSALVNGKLTRNLEAQVLWITSLNRNDWLLRPSLTWAMEKNLRLRVGLDVFKGPPLGFFGRFDHNDRVYSELRYSF